MQQMICGLVGAIGILIVEMILFIRRATQMEQAYEKKPTVNAEAIAQMRSGGLITALPEASVKNTILEAISVDNTQAPVPEPVLITTSDTEDHEGVRSRAAKHSITVSDDSEPSAPTAVDNKKMN
jgi:hypothetical protein